MFFTVKNKRYMSTDQLRASTLLNAYSVIKNYPLKASDLAMDYYVQQQYNKSMKNLCIDLLLNLTFYADDTGNLILLFKNRKHDAIASLITYGNGSIPGCKILQVALRD